MNVGGLEPGADWEYSTDGGTSWETGVGTSFELEPGSYDTDDVLVRQTDEAGNISETGALGAVTVVALSADGDVATADLGGRTSETQPSVEDENLQVLGLLDDGNDTNSIPITVAEGSTGDLVIEVSQTALIAVADAFNVEIYDAEGNRVAVLTTGEDPLVGDVAGLGILGLTSDNTLVANITGLEPGDYTVVVRKGESALGSLLDADGDGVSLEELGEGGVVLGAENQDLVLDAVETALGPVLGGTVRSVLELVLDTTTVLGAGELVDILTEALDNLGLTDSLDDVLGAVADALLSNTLTLIQDTSVSVTLTEHTFSGDGVVSGNVIDPVAGTEGEAGEDAAVPGTEVSEVENAEGVVVELVDGVATIEGAHGTLVINADGRYTYTPNGDPASIGQTEEFTYTISDGSNSAEANLSITIDGERLADDTAQAGIEYQYVETPGESVADAVDYGWTAIVAGLPIGESGNLISEPLTVADNTTQDITLTVDAGSVLGLGTSVTVHLEVFDGTDWVSYASFDNDLLVSLLGSGAGEITIPNVPAGEYRVNAELGFSLASVAGGVSVDVASTVTHLDQTEVSGTFEAEGNLFDNDLPGAEPTSLSISADGTVFEDVVAGSPVTIAGSYGSLLVNADGTYTYTPDDRAGFGTSTDTFTYRVEIDGEVEEATLTVTVNGTGDAPVVAVEAFSASATDGDVVPLGDFVGEGDADGSDEQDFQLGDEDAGITFANLFSEEGDGDLPIGGDADDSVPPEAPATLDDPLGYLPTGLVEDDQQSSVI